MKMLRAIKISTKDNIANILTKHIGGLELEGWWKELGFQEVPEVVANCRLVDQMPISTWDTVQLLRSTSASSEGEGLEIPKEGSGGGNFGGARGAKGGGRLGGA